MPLRHASSIRKGSRESFREQESQYLRQEGASMTALHLTPFTTRVSIDWPAFSTSRRRIPCWLRHLESWIRKEKNIREKNPKMHFTTSLHFICFNFDFDTLETSKSLLRDRKHIRNQALTSPVIGSHERQRASGAWQHRSRSFGSCAQNFI